MTQDTPCAYAAGGCARSTARMFSRISILNEASIDNGAISEPIADNLSKPRPNRMRFRSGLKYTGARHLLFHHGFPDTQRLKVV